jgi:hypothetical protein
VGVDLSACAWWPSAVSAHHVGKLCTHRLHCYAFLSLSSPYDVPLSPLSLSCRPTLLHLSPHSHSPVAPLSYTSLPTLTLLSPHSLTPLSPLSFSSLPSPQDGTWDAPMIPNPVCDAVGCGPWKRPMKVNPAYKGPWSAPQVPNPLYKGDICR